MLRKLLLAAAALTAMSQVATAADLPARPPAPMAPMYSPAPAFSWAGFYIGANAGYGWANTSADGIPGSSNLDGFVGGGQIGYNWQMASPLVLGVEADFQGTGQSHTETTFGITGKEELPWLGTIRGRIGYGFDRAMIYATGGLAYINYKATLSEYGISVSASTTKTGWTLGGGVEWMFWDHWSAKAEYLYIDTGADLVSLLGFPSFNASAKDSIARVGVNYHF